MAASGCKAEVADIAENGGYDPMYGPAVRSKKILTVWWVSGLASMYPAFDWSSAPGHHGYQRACDLISGKASTGHLGHQCSHAPGRPTSISSCPLADLGR